MGIIAFGGWPDTLEELAAGFVNRLIGYDTKYQDAVRIFSEIYLERIAKENGTRAKNLKGGEAWDLEDFLESLLEVE